MSQQRIDEVREIADGLSLSIAESKHTGEMHQQTLEDLCSSILSIDGERDALIRRVEVARKFIQSVADKRDQYLQNHTTHKAPSAALYSATSSSSAVQEGMVGGGHLRGVSALLERASSPHVLPLTNTNTYAEKEGENGDVEENGLMTLNVVDGAGEDLGIELRWFIFLIFYFQASAYAPIFYYPVDA